MKNRVNVKAVIILLGTFAALAVGIHFLHAYQVKRNAGEVYAQALAMQEEGRLAEAVDYLDQFLGLAPGDNEALARLGILRDDLAKTPRARARAFIILEQVLRREADRNDIRRRVVRIALSIGRFSDAEHHLKRLLLESPGDTELMQYMGRCAAGLRKYDEADNWYNEALKQAPTNVGLTVEYAAFLRRRELPALADKAIETMVRANEESADSNEARLTEARIAGARYFRRHGMWKDAARHAEFAVEKLHAEDPDVLLLAADVARAFSKSAEVRKYLERGRQQHPKDTRLAQALAQLELAEGRRDKALRYLEECLANLPADRDELFGLAGVCLDAGEPDQADAVAKRLGQLGVPAYAQCVQAQILMRREAWDAARRVLQAIAVTSAKSRQLSRQVPYLLAQCYERLANPDQRLSAYQQAVTTDPDWPAARRGLAMALAAQGKTDRAIEEYRQAIARAPKSTALAAQLGIELVQLMIAHNARLSAGQRWDDVEQLLTQLTANNEEPSMEVKLMWAQVRALRGRLNEAEKLTEIERKRDPKQPSPWLFLAGLAYRQGKTETIMPLMDAAEKEAGRRVEWDLVRTGYWVRVGGEKAPERLRQIERGVDSLAAGDRPRLVRALAEAWDNLGYRPAADALWRRLGQLQPDDPAVQFLVFERALAAGLSSDAQTVLAKIKQIDGDGPLSACAEAAQLLAQGRGDSQRLADARTCLARAAKLRPTWSRVPVLEAQAFELEQRNKEALERYQVALQRGEDRVFVVHRVLQLLYEQQRYTEAQALVAKLPEPALAVRDLGQLAAALALVDQRGVVGRDPEGAAKALQLARKAARNNPKEYRDQLWLGQVAAAAGRDKEAEDAFRNALELDGTVPAVWAALIQFLATRDVPRAEAELAAARRKLPKDQLPALLAAGYEALGRLSEAEAQYVAMLAAKPSEPALLADAARFHARTSQPAKAEPLLRKLITTQAPAMMTAWARRELAQTLAVQGGYPRVREALTLLETNAVGGETTEDRQVKALVLATQPRQRRAAIATYERLAGTRQANAPEVQFLLAQLYEMDGDWNKARAAFLALLNNHDKNPKYIATYTRALIGRKMLDDAETCLGRLTALAPDAFETVELRARVLQARGRSKEAVAAVTTYANGKDAQLVQAAGLMEELGQPDEAEPLFRAEAARSKRPEAVLILAQHLSRKKLPEALELCERAWKTCPPVPVGFTCVAVLRLGRASDEQYRRVDGWFTAALASHPKEPLLLAAYAEFHGACGRYDEAIRLYRKVHEQRPNDPVPLINLAYLLAYTSGATAEAIDCARRAVELAGPVPLILDTRAAVYLKVGLADKALEDVQAALALAPSPAGYFHLARAQHLANNKAAAVEAYQKALSAGLRPGNLHPLEQPALEQLARELGVQ
jgi:tetratricopeptide (TPR) repeat protein